MSNLDKRLRAALHDLDDRVGETFRPGSAINPSPLPPPPGRFLRPVLAAAAIMALLVLVGWVVSPGAEIFPAPATDPGQHVTPSPTTAGGSQNPGDARRDHVPAAVAALPTSVRLRTVDPITPGAKVQLTTPEGIWVASRPDLRLMVDPKDGCLARAPGDPAYPACLKYSEILLISPDLRTVIRAYPVPDLPVQWLVLADGAVYFGSQGVVANPASVIGRIDRATFALTGRVFPFDGSDQLRTFAGWPGQWSNAPAGGAIGFFGARVRNERLQLLGDDGRVLKVLDSVTLR